MFQRKPDRPCYNLRLTGKNNFTDKVLDIVAVIPRGRTLTYRQVAIRAGRPKAYRAVGNILHSYRVEVWGKLPCHRVIRSDGKIGGYRWGRKKKLRLLRREVLL